MAFRADWLAVAGDERFEMPAARSAGVLKERHGVILAPPNAKGHRIAMAL